MQAAAFRRARRLLHAHSGGVLAARLLGGLQALLILVLVVVAGLVLAMLDSRGQTLLTEDRFEQAPAWVHSREAGRYEGTVIVADIGLYPIVANNSEPYVSPLHRLGARGLLGLMNRLPTLQNNTGALATLMALALLLVLVLSFLVQARRKLLAEIPGRAASTLRRQLHRQMYRLGQSALPSEGVGPVVNLVTREVNDVRRGLASELDHLPRTPILALGLLAIALLLSWKLTLALGSLGLLVWLVALPMNRTSRLEAEAATRDAALQLCLLQEDLGVFRTVRVYGMEDVDDRRFDEHLERLHAAAVRDDQVRHVPSPTTLLMLGAASILAFGLLGYSVLIDQISLASAILLGGSLVGLVHPVASGLALRRTIRQANRSAAAVFEYLERSPELHQTVGAQFLAPIRERITFENVSLTSPSGRTLLDGISVEIPANSRTAVLGLNEECKHALVCLIPRLIDPTVGRVRIDGLDLRSVTLESLRAQIATVFQADLVFSDSVTNNIALGDPSFELPRIIEAAKVAHAHHFIQDLPHGYDTIIGPLGHYLRVDEQYRIALARAYLHDPSIVIIEEPSVPLDDDTKHLIDDTISRLAPGRTLIFLPHRLSTIRSCDQVVVLHNGRLEASGLPRDLQSTSKLYRHIQYVEFNQFATGEIEAGQMQGA